MRGLSNDKQVITLKRLFKHILEYKTIGLVFIKSFFLISKIIATQE